MVSNETPYLTIVIPCKDHWKTTAHCLASIFKSDLTGIGYKVVVVDDACTDYTNKLVHTIMEERDNVDVINHQTSLGYTDSANDVLKTLDTEFILFMNNDVLLEKNCIRELVAHMYKHPEYGLLGGAQYDKNWKENQTLRYFIRGETAGIWNHIRTENLPTKPKDVIRVDATHFACSLCRKSVVDQIGLLSEEFRPGCYEQEDYFLRMKEVGWKIGVVPTAKYIHNHGTSTSDNFIFWQNVLNENRIKWWTKWGTRLQQNLI